MLSASAIWDLFNLGSRRKAGLSETSRSLNAGVRGALSPGNRLACRAAGIDGWCGAENDSHMKKGTFARDANVMKFLASTG